MRTAPLRNLLLASLAAAATTSCTPAADDPPVDTEVEALTAPDWIHPACTPAALAPPVIPGTTRPTCNGPWKYDWEDTSCAAPVCATYKLAYSWDRDQPNDGLGTQFVNEPWTRWPLTGNYYSNTCVYNNRNTLLYCTGLLPSAKCADVAAARKVALWANAITPLTPAMPIPAPLHTFAIAGRSANVTTSSYVEEGHRYVTTNFSCESHATGLPQPTQGRFPVSGCQDYDEPVCQVETGQRASAPGTEAPVDAGPAGHPGWTRSFRDVAPFQSPWCSTCDSAASAADQLACYEANLTVADDPLRRSLVARTKLLYQLSGDLLAPAARARVLELYATDASAPACSSVQTFGPACEGDPTATAMLPQAQLCHDLVANTAAPATVVELELDACVQLLADTDTIADSACQAAAREAIDADLRPLLDRAYPDLTGDLATVLPPLFRRLSTWRIAAGQAARGDAGWLASASARMLGKLWTQLLTSRRPLPDSIDPGDPTARTLAANLVTAVEHDDLTVDLAVLNAAMSDGMPPSPFILALIGDALAGLADRAVANQRFHDVGCALVGCKTGTTARASALAQLTAVLAALPRATAFAQAVQSATLVYGQNPTLWTALAAIRDHYPTLVASWDATGADPADLARLDELATPPPEAGRLAGIVRSARVASGSYQNSGSFSNMFAARPSTAPLQPLALAAMLGERRASTADARIAYDIARVDQVNLALDAARADGAIQAVLDRGRQVADRKQVIVGQIAGLTAREFAERRRMATYQRGFEQIVNTLGAAYEYEAVPLPLAQPSAADARFPAGTTSPSLPRDAFAVSTLTSGEVLRFEVTGGWSPTCRLRGFLGRGPSGPLGITIPTDGQGEFTTGPRGYWASYSESGYQARRQDVSDTESTEFSITLRACLSGALSIPGTETGRASLEACTQFAYSRTHSESTTNSSGDQRTLAADFAIGIRLPGTPFPTAPAGSLLAVVTPHGDPASILDVQVVGEDHTLIAPRLPDGSGGAIDVHLVVNDQAGCPLPAEPSRLTIRQTKTSPLGQVAIALRHATITGLGAIDEVGIEVLRQGQLSAAEANRLRTLAWQEAQQLMGLQGHTLAAVPAELRQWFEYAIDASLASIDRRAQLMALRIETDVLDAEIDAAAHELLFANVQRYLTGLLPRLRLRALDSGQYLAVAAALAEAVAVFVPQTLTLRRLTWQPSRAAEIIDKATRLVDQTLVAPPVEAVVALEQLAASIQAAVGSTQFDPSPPTPQLVVVAIPFPRSSTDPLRYAGPYHQVSAAAATAFWAEAASPAAPRATIALTPENLYGGAQTAARLNCATEAPMVRRMAVFLEHAYTSDLNTLSINASVTAAAAAPIDFPILGRLFTIPAVPGGVPASLRVLGDRAANEVANKFAAYVQPGLGAGAGLSPFTSFAIDMAFFRDPALVNFRTTARALYLVFELEGREGTSQVTVPGLCGAVPPAP